MTPKSPDEIARYYTQRLATHGDTAQGAGWPNETDRQRRFAVMAGLGGGDFSGQSLCDVACGTGVFLEFLKAGAAAPASYTGIDIDPSAIAQAKEKLPEGRFICADLLAADAPEMAQVDFVVLNGLFTVRADLDEDAMWDFMTAMLQQLWPLARRGLAFNVMSDVVDWRRDDLFHVPMDRLARFLFDLAGRRVVLRNDYDLYEYTAYVYRDEVGARDGVRHGA